MAIPGNRRGFMHLKELHALSAKLRAFHMKDRNMWTDFMLKLEALKDSSGILLDYQSYDPEAKDPRQRGFKSFLQVTSS